MAMNRREIKKLLTECGYVFPTDVSLKNLNLLVNLGSKPIILYQDTFYIDERWKVRAIYYRINLKIIRDFKWLIRPFNEKDFNTFFKMFKTGLNCVKADFDQVQTDYMMRAVLAYINSHSYGKFENV